MSDLKWILPSALIWTIMSLETGFFESPIFFPITVALAVSLKLLYLSLRQKEGIPEEKIDLELCKKICDDNGYVIESKYGGFVIKLSGPAKGYFQIDGKGRTLQYVVEYCVHKTLLDAQKWILKNRSFIDKSEFKPVFGAGIDLIKEQNEQHLELKDLVSQMVDAHNKGDLVKEEEIFDIIEKRKLV